VTVRDGARSRRRLRVRVTGTVQGVGYRPFVAGLAVRLQLTGFVGNDPRGVFVEAEGDSAALEELLRGLEAGPPLSRVESVRSEPLALGHDRAFRVVASALAGTREALVAADAATCADCLAELADPADRRFGYPFVNCTNCGPRLTIVTGVPYDRATTTMAAFAMCAACGREYEDPSDRRFHAEPVCCPECGPRLMLVDNSGAELPDGGNPLATAATMLLAEAVVAVKGLGGYHLAALATSRAAVATLRDRKHREDRPFALMVQDLASARELCEVRSDDAEALTGPARPIVVMPRGSGPDRLAPAVAPGQACLGVMLPYTPLHHLLLAAVGQPLVLTSGNVSDEPIAFDDEDALRRLGPLVDALLVHDRAIRTRVDDSVLRSRSAGNGGGGVQPVRRSRGFVPTPVPLPVPAPRPILACGPELKNTFCLVRGGHAFVSHHIGDLENYETLRSYTDGIDHFRRLFAVEPVVVAHDLHPEYLSTKHAFDLAEADSALELVGVQHHHAHIASCLADNGRTAPVIGVAFDGLGMGTDGTLWGGEFLVADLVGFERAAHLTLVPMPGGQRAVREPWRMTAAYAQLLGLGGRALDSRALDGGALAARHGRRWAEVQALIAAGVNSPLTSSAGRLFDAVAALIGLRDEVTYEGQAAIDLEQRADPSERGVYPARVLDGPPLRVCGEDLVAASAADLRAGRSAGVIATRFHRGLARAVVDTCCRIRDEVGLTTAALTGGVFQNVLLTAMVTDGLSDAGFEVLRHREVPPNDGGISLGQAAVAAARDAAPLPRR
jgi:hydrogenase maturation protein HypF